MSNYGEILREARKRAGLKQKVAAELIGVDKALLSIYEHGRTIVKPDRLDEIARAYNDSLLWRRYMRAAYPSYARYHPETLVAEKQVVKFFAEDRIQKMPTVYVNEMAKKIIKKELALKIAAEMINAGVMVIDEQEADGMCRITETVYAVEGA